MRRLLSFIAIMFLAAATIGVSQASAADAPTPPKPRIMYRGNAPLDHAVPASLKPATPPPASASASGLTIVPTFDTSITSNSHAAAIKAAINAAIQEFEAHISTPITVNIAFESVNTGLGSSSTFINNISYNTYRSDLANHTTHSADDNTALASLPATANLTITTSLPLLRAIGESVLGHNNQPFDSTIGLNTAITNLARTGPQDPNKYDLEAVTLHEITEVLGAGGGGSELNSNPAGNWGSLDLFRYNGAGTRSHTTDPNEFSYFSIDGGQTNNGFFNQDSGGDYADWDGDRDGSPRVQDAFATPGTHKDLDSGEWRALDVVGQTLKATK